MITVVMGFVVVMMILSLIYSYGFAVENGVYYLGITLPKQYRSEEAIINIRKEYKKKLCSSSLITIISSLIIFVLQDYISAMIVYLMAWFFGCIFIYDNAFMSAAWKVYNWKTSQNWYIKEEPKRRVDTTVSRQKKKMSVPIYFGIFPLALIILAAVHMSNNGIRWVSLSFAICTVMFLLIYYVIAHMSNKVYCDDSNANLLINKSIKFEWSRFMMVSAYGAAICTYLFEISRYGTGNMVGAITFSVMILLVPMAFMLIAYGNTRRVKDELAPARLYDDDDIYFLLGKKNPNQSSISEKRAGIGFSFNTDKKGEYIIIGVVFAFVCALALFLLKYDLADITYNIEEKENKQYVVIAAVNDKSYIPVDEIYDVCLIQRPKMSKDNGYDGTRHNLGIFNVDGYGKCETYVYLRNDEVIVIKTKNKAYIFNDEEPDVTEKIYNELITLITYDAK